MPPDPTGEPGPTRPHERVTTVVSRRVKAGREQEFEDWAHGIIMVACHYPGHLSTSVLHDAGSRDYHILFQFTDQPRLRAWMESPERTRWLARVADLIEEERGVQQTTGLETWFSLPRSDGATSKPPERRKMWLVSLVAVYPLVLLFLTFVAPHVKGWPVAARAVLFPFVLLTLMTYVVMPLVTRAMRRWSRRRAREASAEEPT